jgi:hypothetical protein
MRKLGVLVYLFFFTCSAFSQEAQQKLRIGLGADVNLSNNGHGAFYGAHISVSKGRNSFKAGPLVHQRSMRLTGGRISYSYILAGMDGEEQMGITFPEANNGSCRISLYAYLQYVNNTGLSYTRTREETSLYIDTIPVDWNTVRISTIEGALGTEIDVKLFGYVQWRTFVGLGVYSYLNPVHGMYQETTGLMFMIGTGIDIPSFKKNKK